MIAAGAKPEDVTPAKLLGVELKGRHSGWQKPETAATAAQHLLGGRVNGQE